MHHNVLHSMLFTAAIIHYKQFLRPSSACSSLVADASSLSDVSPSSESSSLLDSLSLESSDDLKYDNENLPSYHRGIDEQ
jgi:hypothetical protein